MEQAETLSHIAFAETFLERVIEFLRERPAYLKLLAAPIRFSRDPAARRALRVAIANAFRAKDPSLTQGEGSAGRKYRSPDGQRNDTALRGSFSAGEASDHRRI